MKGDDTLRDRVAMGAFLLLVGLVVVAFALKRTSEVTGLVRELSILITLLLMGEAAAEAMGNWRALAAAIGRLADGYDGDGSSRISRRKSTSRNENENEDQSRDHGQSRDHNGTGTARRLEAGDDE